MEQCFDNVKIRGLINSDIDDVLRWNTTEVAWQDRSMPWHVGFPVDEQEFGKYLLELADIEPMIDFQPEVECDGVHIGRCRAHFIDENGKFSALEDATCKKLYVAFEVFICEPDYANEDVCTKAIACYAEYLMGKARDTVFVQAWASDELTVRSAGKVGFDEYCRASRKSMSSDDKFEIVTFKLDLDKFARFKEEYR